MLIKPRQLLKLNLKLYLDQAFIRDGCYQNIAKGTTAYDGTDLSKLACAGNSSDLAQIGFTTTTGAGKVWQSPFRNWVYESGLVHSYDRGETKKDSPTLCSGVYVNNTFKPSTPTMPWGSSEGWDPTCYPTIDWMNGRVVMSSGLDSGDTVQAEYSYGEVSIQIANRRNANLDEYIGNTKYGTNTDFYDAVHYPSGRFQPMPVVFIQVTNQRHESYEIGNRSLIELAQAQFYCYSRSSTVLDNILDTIRLQDRRHLPMVDFNVAPIPLSGFLGERSPNYVLYSVLQNNAVVNPSGYSSLYADARFEDANVTADSFADFEYGLVEMTIRSQIIVPDSALGTSALGYNYWT